MTRAARELILSRRLRALRFVAVGGFTALVQLSLLALALAYDVNGYIANLLAFGTAAQINFLLHSGFTWHDRSGGRWAAQLPMRWAVFHACIAGTASINLATYVAASFFVPHLMAAAAGTGTAAILNFFANDRLTFHLNARLNGGPADAAGVLPKVWVTQAWRAHRQLLTVLVAVVLLGVGVRTTLVLAFGHDSWYPNMVYTNANVASNIESGAGYVSTVSVEAMDAVNRPFTRLLGEAPSFQEVAAQPHSAPATVSPQYLPGFPYFAAAIWALTPGPASYTPVQLATGILDGALGPLLLWGLLAAAGYSRAGTLAAFGYAIQPALIYQSTRFMPDSLSAVLPLLAAVVLVAGLRYRRDVLGVAGAGFIIGLGGWLRGDYLAVVALLLPVIVLFVPRSRSRRLALGAVLLVAWAVPSVALSAFYAEQYGEFQLTRPGTGLLLWEGIGQQDNPWGIGATSGENLDQAASRLLNARGYEYGSWEGDAFLLSETLSHVADDPAWFVGATVKRALRVLSIKAPGAPPWMEAGVTLLLAPLVLGGIAILRRTAPLVTAVLVALLLSRLIPFSLMYDQARFVILILPIYTAFTAVSVVWLLERSAQDRAHPVWRGVSRAAQWLGLLAAPSPGNDWTTR